MNLTATAPVGKAPVAANRLPKPVYYTLVATLVMFLAANTFVNPVSGAINALKWVPLACLCAAALVAFRGRKLPECPPVMLILMLAFVMTGSVSAATSVIGINSFGAMASVLLVVLTGYALAALIVSTGSRRSFFELIATLTRIMVVAAVLFRLAGINLGRAGGFTGWVDNPNTLAAMIAPGFIIFIAGCLERRPGWQYWHLPFLVVCVPLMLATEGRASYLWVIVSIGSFWIYRRGSWPAAVALMIFAIVMIGWWEPITSALAHWAQLDIAPERGSADGSPLSGREEIWRIGAELFGDRPIFGYGMGSSMAIITPLQWRFVRFQGLHFHSSYLMSAIETGLIGLLVLLAIIIATIARGVADSKRTRVLPREEWPTAALPFALFTGALAHAIFKSWLIAGGNVNAPLFWTMVWLIHFQAQVPIRRVVQRAAAAMPRRRGLAGKPA